MVLEHLQGRWLRLLRLLLLVPEDLAGRQDLRVLLAPLVPLGLLVLAGLEVRVALAVPEGLEVRVALAGRQDQESRVALKSLKYLVIRKYSEALAFLAGNAYDPADRVCPIPETCHDSRNFPCLKLLTLYLNLSHLLRIWTLTN